MKFKECPYCGAALDFGERCDCQRANVRQPHVLTMEQWKQTGDFENFARPGDPVEQAIVDSFLNAVPPATYRADLIQCGEPHDHREDPKIGRYRPTFATFGKRGGQWYYCGNCFHGETTERGQRPPYIGRTTA